MSNATQIEIRVSGAKVTNAMVMPDGTCKLTIEMENAGTMVNEVEDDKSFLVESSKPIMNIESVLAKKSKLSMDDRFVLVEASKLSLDDEFMQYEIKYAEEREFKKQLEKVIKNGVRDFWRPKCDPSFADHRKGICYEPGEMPAVYSKTYNWWSQVARKFKPEYHSRLGTKTEYIAFLGVLIKRMIASGWSADEAWYSVCVDSREIGHYWERSRNGLGWPMYGPTGDREVCGFYDLANSCKILAEDDGIGGFCLASGCHLAYEPKRIIPLADIRHTNYDIINDKFKNCVGWLVLD